MPKVIVYVPAADARWLDERKADGHAKWVRGLVKFAIAQEKRKAAA
jgi:hypothetical protein